jgi:hypothetical protein
MHRDRSAQTHKGAPLDSKSSRKFAQFCAVRALECAADMNRSAASVLLAASCAAVRAGIEKFRFKQMKTVALQGFRRLVLLLIEAE